MGSSLRELTLAARSVRVFDETVKADVQTLEDFVDCARLTPSAANRQPLKYKICCDRDIVSRIQPLTRWAGYIKERELPPKDKCPTAFIVICHDSSVCAESPFSHMDVGIAAQTINLAARERGFGTCMIGSFDKDKLAGLIDIPESCTPVLVIAVGAPGEYPAVCPVKDGDIKYFRDAEDKHFVPKRSLEEVLL